MGVLTCFEKRIHTPVVFLQLQPGAACFWVAKSSAPWPGARTRACPYTASACTTVINPGCLMVWTWMLWVIACGWNTNGSMVWAGCPGHGMLLEHEREYGLPRGFPMDAMGYRILLEHQRDYGLGMDALGHRMLLEHERDFGLGMDALGDRMLL